MDNRKRSLTGSGQTGQQKPESGSGRNQILKTWWEKQEPAGFGTASLNRRTGPGWRRFHGDK